MQIWRGALWAGGHCCSPAIISFECSCPTRRGLTSSFCCATTCRSVSRGSTRVARRDPSTLCPFPSTNTRAVLFVYNLAQFLYADRLKASLKTSRDSNKGQAIWFLFGRRNSGAGAPAKVLPDADVVTVPLTSNPMKPDAAVPIPAPAAAPPTVKGVFNSFFSDSVVVADFVVAAYLLAAFVSGTSALLTT